MGELQPPGFEPVLLFTFLKHDKKQLLVSGSEKKKGFLTLAAFCVAELNNT